MKSTFNILFYIKRNDVKRNGLASIIVRVTIDGKRCQFNSKLEVNPNAWDQKSQKAIGRSVNDKSLNPQLQQLKMQLGVLYCELTRNNREISPHRVRDAFLSNRKECTLIYQFERHNKHCKNLVPKSITHKTYTRYELTKNRLIEFLEIKYHNQDIRLQDITPEFIENFFVFLKEYYRCSHNTAMKFVQRFRTIINYTTSMSLITINPFDFYRVNFEKTKRTFLNQQEITAIWNKKFASRRLEQVRDAFIFSCYTGLSYIDLCGLTQANIEVGFNGRLWIIVQRHKTHQPSTIPLLKIPQELLVKYKREYDDESIFPINSNQKMNEYLKEIAIICGITKTITFHVARHSFATTVTLGNGIPIETISKMLGHTRIETTQIYAKVTNLKISQDMKLLLDRDF